MAVPVGAAMSMPECGLRGWSLKKRRNPNELERGPFTGCCSENVAGTRSLKSVERTSQALLLGLGPGVVFGGEVHLPLRHLQPLLDILLRRDLQLDVAGSSRGRLDRDQMLAGRRRQRDADDGLAPIAIDHGQRAPFRKAHDRFGFGRGSHVDDGDTAGHDARTRQSGPRCGDTTRSRGSNQQFSHWH